MAAAQFLELAGAAAQPSKEERRLPAESKTATPPLYASST
jgi:hypothetical protein